MTEQQKRGPGRPRKQAAPKEDAVESTQVDVKKAVDFKGRPFNEKWHEHKGGVPVVKDGLLVMKERSARAPIGATQQLDAKKWKKENPGMSFRWVNNVAGRIGDFEEHDWVPVDGGKVRKVVSQSDGTEAILMMKPEEYYEQDQKAKERLIASTEKSANTLKEGEYVPEGHKRALAEGESFLA